MTQRVPDVWDRVLLSWPMLLLQLLLLHILWRSAETALGTSAYCAVRLCSRIVRCIEIVIYSKRLRETSISSQLSQTFFATLR